MPQCFYGMDIDSVRQSKMEEWSGELNFHSRGEETGGALLEITLRGNVRRVTFYNPETGFAVLRLRCEKQLRDQTVIGILPNIQEGQDIEAKGRWEKHPEHGMQFHVSSYQAVLPSSPEGIQRYLSSGILHGIGPRYAEKIVRHFGADTIRILDQETERLKEVPQLGKKRIEQIRQCWKEANQGRAARIFLHGLGLTPAFCTRLIQKYGEGAAPDIVRRNPYRLASEVDGIGFLRADAIARSLGISTESPLRLCAGAIHAMNEVGNAGHICTTLDFLVSSTAHLLEISAEQAYQGILLACETGKLIAEQEDGTRLDPRQLPGFSDTLPQEGAFPPLPEYQPRIVYIYLGKMLRSETHLAEMIQILLRVSPPSLPKMHSLNLEATNLNPEQIQAVKQTFSHGFSIVTGGPGVGKTTVIRQIVSTAKQMKMKICLAAPTGRAAKRMSESAGTTACTVHRLLKWDVASHQFTQNADAPLECDLLVVDEASMLDISLSESLLDAVAPGRTRVLLVGDKDQLPSVGPGAVLQDLIASRKIPVTYLHRVYRQAEGSRIILNAHAVNGGNLPDISPALPGQKSDFYWIEQEQPISAADIISRLVSQRIPAVFGLSPVSDIQVLSPMRKGDCGTSALNDLLQERLNPPSDGKAEFHFGNHLFRVGDKLMQTSNNYDKGVFNGEMGILKAIDTELQQFQVEFDIGTVTYAIGDAGQLQLAYAVTIHKSQGSEFPAVVVPLLTQHYVMLQKNLLYTAMTRAKKLLILIGSRRALNLAVRNDTPNRRLTRLIWRLRHLPDF